MLLRKHPFIPFISMDFIEAQKQITNIQNESEKNVAELLLNLGFDFIASNSIVNITEGQRIGEIDLLFTFEDYLFIIEVSKDRHSGNSKKITFFTKWEDRGNLSVVHRQYQLRHRKAIRVYFDLSAASPENPSAELQRITQDGKNNKVAYKDDFEYFLNCYTKIGEWAKNDLLDWLDYEEGKKSQDIQAFQYYIGDVPVFCFISRVDDLLRTCYVSRRRTKDLGYQRTLKEHRLNDISNSIKKGEGLLFPNSILINVPNMVQHMLPPEQCPALLTIHFPSSYNSCRIIDGQHRLLGFSNLPKETQQTYHLPVISLQEYDRDKEIKTFVDINSKQQRIDGNLILLLKADLDWPQEAKEFKQKIAVQVVQELNRSYFKDRIYFGMANELRGEKITLTTLVSAMVHNKLVKESVNDTLKKLKEVFFCLQQYLPDYSFRARTYFGQNRGITVLFRLLYLIQRNAQSNRMNVSKEIFFSDLSTIFDTDFVVILDKYYGEGGANDAASHLINRLKESYPGKYARMETNLNFLRRSS